MTIRIAHVTTIATSLELLLLNQLRSLAEEGYQVVGISAPGSEVDRLREHGIEHLPVPLTRRLTPWTDLIALWRLWRIFRRERFTIVHTHTPKPGLLGQLAARLAGVPIVVNTIHGFYFHDDTPPLVRRTLVALEKLSARCSTAILSQSAEDMETALAEGICGPDKMEVLGNGIDLDRFTPNAVSQRELDRVRRELNLPQGTPVVGFVGRLVVEKGVLDLLAAARRVLAEIPNAHFLFVGPLDTEKTDAFSPTSPGSLGEAASACRFAGMREDMTAMYSLMDLFVLPSHREGFPRASMEAAAMGLPRIVTDIRGCRETVRHGHDGLLVPVREPDSLAQAIIDCLQRPEQAARFGDAARQTALARFDERQVFAKVKEVYRRQLAALDR